MKNSNETAIVNPFALAELITNQKYDWDKIEKPEQILEEVFKRPIYKLLDPKFNSPLFPGLNLKKDFSFEKAPLKDLTIRKEIKREDISNTVFPSHLSKLLLTADIEDLSKKKKEWETEDFEWKDVGHFFNKAADFFDPIQGSVANCYFIAALSSVAWTRPFQIAHRTRSSGPSQEEYFCMIKFYRKGSLDTKNANTREIEVTEKLPVLVGTNRSIYARSFDPNEIWPGVYEKAFAKWITRNNTDSPNIPATAWGSAARAVKQLTNFSKDNYRTTRWRSAKSLYDFVSGNSQNRKTKYPMVAATYQSADEAPGSITYSDLNLAASHEYSVLGHFMRSNKRYIVLRNPWGVSYDTSLTISGTYLAKHVSWWKHITLGTRGVFAIEAPEFKRYFKRIWVIKP
jgi:hypothetical protein